MVESIFADVSIQFIFLFLSHISVRSFFRDKYLYQMTTRMHEALDKLTGDLPSGGYSLYSFLSQFIFRASLQGLINTEAAEIDGLYEDFLAFDNVMPLSMAGMPFSFFPKALSGRERLIETCRRCTENTSELISKRQEYFQTLFPASKIPQPEKEAAKNQVPMLWASVSNTMPGTFWAIYHLLANPTCLQKVIAELRQYLPTDCTVMPSQEALNQLVYTDACLTEALRLSSGSLIMRGAVEACEFTMQNGKTYRLRKGDRLGIIPPLFHYDADLYPNPNQFQPERWIVGETLEEQAISAMGKLSFKKQGKPVPSSTAYLVFGAGITLCPGRRFARNEVKLLLIFLLSRFEFAFPLGIVPPHPGVDGSRAGIGIFPPQSDVKIEVKRIQ
jgi:cytochrome P450